VPFGRMSKATMVLVALGEIFGTGNVDTFVRVCNRNAVAAELFTYSVVPTLSGNVVVAPPLTVRPPVWVLSPIVVLAVMRTGEEVDTALLAYTQNGSAVRPWVKHAPLTAKQPLERLIPEAPVEVEVKLKAVVDA